MHNCGEINQQKNRDYRFIRETRQKVINADRANYNKKHRRCSEQQRDLNLVNQKHHNK